MTLTFGQVLAAERKTLGLSQKDLAARILKEDGSPISPQYLNDIERDRRNPPGHDLIAQFAKALGFEEDYLFYLAGQIPPDLRNPPLDRQAVSQALVAFRKAVGGLANRESRE